MKTIVYVDRNLSIGIAVGLVGNQLKKGQSSGSRVGFNWLIQDYVSQDESSKITRDIKELLPEV